ncbi:MAG: hypothetical protein ABI193_05680 [Minicystis sp.]
MTAQESNSEAGIVTARGLGGRRVRVLAHGGMSGKFLVQDECHLYWTDSVDQTLTRLPKDGGVPLILVTGQGGIGAMTRAGGWLYWVNASQVVRMPEQGGDVEVLADGLLWPKSIAVRGDVVVWTDYGHGGDEGTVQRLTLGDRRVVRLAEGQKMPTSVSIDQQHVYWVNHGVKRPDYFKDGSVVRVPLEGDRAPTVLATDQRLASSLVMDDAAIYWVTALDYDSNASRGALWKWSKAGGAVVELASWRWNEATHLALDETHVYWLAPIRLALFRVRKDGGEEEQMMTEDNVGRAALSSSFVVDERCVYWTVHDSGRAGGAVFKMAK